MSEPDFQLRRAVPADAAALAEFAARVFSDTFAADNRPEDMAAHLAGRFGVRQQTEELTNPDVVTLLLTDGSEEAGGDGLIAFAQVRRYPPPDCVTGEAPVELGRFYVDRSWHGRGLAQPLMAAVRDAGRELGGRTLWLGVWERNARAIAFYEKCGFRDVGSQAFLLGADLQTDRIMVATL